MLRIILSTILVFLASVAYPAAWDVYIPMRPADDSATVTQVLPWPGYGLSAFIQDGTANKLKFIPLSDNFIVHDGAMWVNPSVLPAGPSGDKGDTGSAGAVGADGKFTAFSHPVARSVSVSAAYQSTSSGLPSSFFLNLTSTSTISLSGTTNNEGGVWMGPDASVASTGGTKVCDYKNSFGGSLVIGLTLSASQSAQCVVMLPAGWYFAVRQTTGSGMTVSTAFEQGVE